MTPPTTCICTRHAVGLGIANRNGEPTWLCNECSYMIDEIKRAKRPSVYELKAREGGMDAAGPLVEEFGPDLSEWSEEQVLRFCGAVWTGCADRLRQLIREDGAPW